MAGHAKAVTGLQDSLSGRSVTEALAELDEAGVERINGLGFRMDTADIGLLREKAGMSLDQRQIEQLLRSTTLKQRFAIRHAIRDINKVSPVMLFDKIRSRREANWLKVQAEDIGETLTLGADRIRQIADARMRRERLAEIETRIAGVTVKKGLFGFSSRVLWVIVVSLIVCVVGITNAMLMSVTERFTEIATMKCLGAADGFIMINFILESGLQGFAGGIIGGLLGFVLGIVKASTGFGLMAVQNVPVLALIVVFFACLAIGIVLSTIAAIYPAWVAARLAPLEAMRVE
jgi:cell division protein FtsX